jgi:hypothetical protein
MGMNSNLITLRQLLERCISEVSEADAAMQLHQRQAWREFSGSNTLIEGLDHCEFLGLSEINLTFKLKTRSPFINWVSNLFGKNNPKVFKIISSEGSGNAFSEVSFTIKRNDRNAFEGKVNETDSVKEDSYVTA